MNKLLEKIGMDKVLHCLASFVISVVAAVIVKLFTDDKASIAGLAWMITFVVTFGKEISDECNYGGADRDDYIADAIGYTVGSVIVYLLMV